MHVCNLVSYTIVCLCLCFKLCEIIYQSIPRLHESKNLSTFGLKFLPYSIMTTARYVMQIIIPKLLSKMICQLIYFIFLNYKYGLFITCTIKGLSKFVQFTKFVPYSV